MPDFSIEIGDAQIQNAIAMAIAEQFPAERRDQLLRDVIRAHLSVKQNSYDRETLLAKQVGQQIREIATEVMRAKIDEWRPDIEAIVSRMLGAQFKASIVQQLERALSRVVVDQLTVVATLGKYEDDE